MTECGKKDTCKNYDKKCSQCWANSSIYDTHPCYASKDLVEVVRCKGCYYCRESDTTNRFFCTYQDTEFETYPNSYCSNGTPQNDEVRE